jgi:hypothetical protein
MFERIVYNSPAYNVKTSIAGEFL